MLSSFQGFDPNGEWILFLADVSGEAEMSLKSWGLEIESSNQIVPELAPGAVACRLVLRWSSLARPTPKTRSDALSRILHTMGCARRMPLAVRPSPGARPVPLRFSACFCSEPKPWNSLLRGLEQKAAENRKGQARSADLVSACPCPGEASLFWTEAGNGLLPSVCCCRSLLSSPG